MRLRLTVAVAALAASFFVAGTLGRANPAQDAALDAPPDGIVPTAAHLSAILAAHEKAVGVFPAGEKDTLVEKWTFVDAGQAGDETLERSGDDYHSRITAGPFVEQYGQHAGNRWHQDENGYTSTTTEIDETSFYANRVLEDAADPKNDVTVLGETTGAAPAFVLKIRRPGFKHPEFVFYDKGTGQIVRVEHAGRSRRYVETYGDFRTTNGVSRSWHEHDSDGRPELDDDWTLTSVVHGGTVPEAAFQMPPYRPTVSRVMVATAIPARTSRAGYIVRVDVNGRGYDFVLDCINSVSIIDYNVAREMGLPAFGHATQLSNGSPVQYRTMIPDGDVAGIHLHNFALTVDDVAYNPSESVKVVGVLGYDFFMANVLHFDFANRTLEALPIAGFGDTQPVADGMDVPLEIDDGLPLVAMGVGDTVTNRAVLGQSFLFSMLFGSFVDEHPNDVRNKPGDEGKHGQRIVPFADDGTYGVKAEVWTSVVSDLRFAIANFRQFGITTTNYPLTLHDRPVDALVGMDYLQYFDLYFDYPYGRLIVKPNAFFFKTFKKNG